MFNPTEATEIFLTRAEDLETEHDWPPPVILDALMMASISYGRVTGVTAEQMLDLLETMKERVRMDASAGRWESSDV